MNSSITQTIIGIGLNVNQKSFPEKLPNPISLIMLLNREFSVEEIANCLCEKLELIQDNSSFLNVDAVFEQYNNLLYRRNTWHYFLDDRNEFKGMIIGVEKDGSLIMKKEDNTINRYLFGEIKYKI